MIPVRSSGLRVAVVGNMNNGPFALTRHLRDRQIDAQLLFAPLLGHEVYFPQADTFDLADLGFCHAVPWLDDGFYRADPEEIRQDMRGYDAVLATGSEAAALSLAGVPIDIYFPYGDDVVTYAHFPKRFSPRQVIAEELRCLLRRRRPTLRIRAETQHGHTRRAICTAKHLICDWTNDWWDELMLSLPLGGTLHRTPWPFLYPAPYRAGRSTDVHWRSAMDDLRAKHDLLLLYHGRHEWTRPHDPNSKNTDHLLRGFAEFLRAHPDLGACLATVEYGQDVAASKALITELGVEDRVVWFPQMYRKDLMYLAARTDLCFGEFEHSFLTGGIILEALSLGKPLIHHRDDRLYPDLELYPVLHAREPAEIATAIATYVDDSDGWMERGKEGAAWFDEYVVRRPLDLICKLLGVEDACGNQVDPGKTPVDVS